MILRRIKTFGWLLSGTSALFGCASRGPYKLNESYTVAGMHNPAPCPRARPPYIVPELPATDRLLGDVVVSCERHCPQQYAIDALMHLAEQHGATRVSALSCVQQDTGWICVGHASATPLCEES